MNLDNEELDITKMRRNKIKYTKLIAENKGLTIDQFKEFYKAYCELYDLLCEYMNAYNRECKDYEQTINELYEEKERYRKLYFDLKDTTKEALDKMEYHADYETHDIYNNLKNKVTEKELKDMILGMLE